MAVTITGPVGNLTLDGGTPRLSTSAVSVPGLEVWVTEITAGVSTRVVQVPEAAILGCTYTERDGKVPQSDATLTVDRNYLLDPETPTSWLVAELLRVEREIQIVHANRVVFWGPILTVNRKPGKAETVVTATGCEWYLSRALMRDPVNLGPNLLISATSFFDRFDDGLDNWTVTAPTPVLDSVHEETGTYCIDLDGGTIAQYQTTTGRVGWRLSARVWIDTAVADATEILIADVDSALGSGGSPLPAVRRAVTAAGVPRDSWQTIVIDWEVMGDQFVTRRMVVSLSATGAAAGEVLVDSVSMLPAITNFAGIIQGHYALDTHAAAWEEIIGRVRPHAILGTSDTGNGPVGRDWARPDVWASEAARQLTEAGGCEVEMMLSLTTRVAALRIPERGTEHSAVSLTLSFTAGNIVTAEAWQSGTTTPTTEWIIADDAGRTGSYRERHLVRRVVVARVDRGPDGHAPGSPR
ncbi:MAG: hypothetical protein IPJ47_16580 [Anaerolineales bacterium]|nr:hypothetical protein [Anaerolineales bacterium]